MFALSDRQGCVYSESLDGAVNPDNAKWDIDAKPKLLADSDEPPSHAMPRSTFAAMSCEEQSQDSRFFKAFRTKYVAPGLSFVNIFLKDSCMSAEGLCSKRSRRAWSLHQAAPTLRDTCYMWLIGVVLARPCCPGYGS